VGTKFHATVTVGKATHTCRKRSSDTRSLCTFDAIRAVSDRDPVGWHTRSAPSVNTRRLLTEHGGLLYDSDAYNYDLPYLIAGSALPHVVIPYSFETNDTRFQPGGGFVQASDFATYCIGAFDRLWLEGANGQPKLMSIGLHLRIIGRPGRITKKAELGFRNAPT
jgi:allantoinase